MARRATPHGVDRRRGTSRPRMIRRALGDESLAHYSLEELAG
jgi:hypothetical protein